MTDAEIINGIKCYNEEAAKALYLKHKEYCLRFMDSKYSDHDTNLDIYQDALIVFIEKVRANQLNLENTSIQTYLNAICKNQVWNRINKKNKPADLDDGWEESQAEKLTDWFDDQEDVKTDRIRIIMEELQVMKDKGQICYELLYRVFFENRSLDEVAGLMNYTNADNAKNQSYRCRERLKKQVFERLK